MATRPAILLLISTLFGASVLPLAAQEIVAVQVFTEPSGARFTVDGLQYMARTVFNWPVGSKHVISIVSPTYATNPTTGSCEIPIDASIVQYSPGCLARYRFIAWETSAGKPMNGTATIQSVTVDKNLTFVMASFLAEYKVNVVFYERPGPVNSAECHAMARYPGPKPNSAGPGVIFVGDECLDRTAALYAEAGTLALQAIPFDGYVFRGWTFDSSPSDQAQFSSVEVKASLMVSPRFEPAKRVHFYTSPRGLKLRLDSTVVDTIDPERFVPSYPIGGYLDWVGGSRHIVAGVSPQVDIENRTWVFKNWSNGGGQNLALTVDNETNVPFELTGNFVRGVTASMLTAPLGLKLSVEGRDNWPTTNFIWGVGMSYDVSAPAEQTDTHGRKYLFKGWSNGGAASQKITPEESQTASGIRMIAKFEAMPQAIIQSSVSGMKITIDGAQCTSPCRLDKASGTVLNISVPAMVDINGNSRHEFVGWSDGAAAARTVTVDADTQTVTAIYRTAYRLIVGSEPADGATFVIEPASADGFYAAETNVAISAEAKEGFKFRRWDGDLSGLSQAGVVAMSTSRLVRAMLDRVPFVGPTGVRNAAADLPEPGVAAGLIAIYGGSLAKSFEVANSNPLTQTLGGTVVLVEDRLLPLIYVSPEQINAQLPADLEPGEYKLVVRTEGLVDVTSKVIVVRNAPGLFANMVDGIAFAAALHEDGSPVTVASPAKRSETISLIGTGFGPYNRPVLDGFVTPGTPAATLVDPVAVMAGDASIQPSFAGAMPGFVGMTATRFRVGGAGAASLPVKVLVNGRESNTVILPVE